MPAGATHLPHLQQYFIILKRNSMHYTNFTYLTNRLQDTGFGNALNDALHAKLKDQPSSFELPYKVWFGPHVLNITLCVKKWKNDGSSFDMYYFQKYHASLSRENGLDQVMQDFYFSRTDPAW